MSSTVFASPNVTPELAPFGPPERQCSARSKRTGARCRRPAMIGGTVCYHHGGASPNALAKARERVAEQSARRYFADQPVPELTDPFGALVQVVSETTAWYAFLRDQVAQMDADTYESAGGEGAPASLSAYVTLLERAQDRTERMLRELVRLGLEERLVRISERQADMIGAVIEGVLRRVVDDASVLVRARETVPAVIREVTARAT